jgi:hypothetical protein
VHLSAKKVQTIEDYYVAGRNVGPILLGIHYGTVYFSSVLMVGGGTYAYRFGLSTMWIAIENTVLGAFLPFLLFGNRIRVFSEALGALTLPDFFRERYQSRFMHVARAILDLAMIAWACLSAAMRAPPSSTASSGRRRRATRRRSSLSPPSCWLWPGVHEFLVSQLYACIAFPIVNYVARSRGSGVVEEGLVERLRSSL